MGKVTLDLSEFKLIEEGKANLKKALENERELQNQISQLNDEKVKLLESAKMKVVKVIKNLTIEEVVVERNFEVGDIVKSILRRTDPWSVRNGEVSELVRHLKSELFAIKKRTLPVQEEITTHGLDDIKYELRKELKEDLDSGIKQKIKEADKIIDGRNSETRRLEVKIGALMSENSALKADNQSLKTELDKCDTEIKTSRHAVNSIAKAVNILEGGYGLLGRGKMLDNILSILKGGRKASV